MKTLKQKILIPLFLLGFICIYMSVNNYITTRMTSQSTDSLNIYYDRMIQLEKIDMRVQELQKL